MTPPPIAELAPRLSRPLRLIALDLDGTCLDMHQELAPRTREAVHAAVARGISCAVATGRMYRSAVPWARELHAMAPLICYQGAVVRELPDEGSPQLDGVPVGTLLFEDSLAPDPALRALALARRNNWHVQAYQNERLLCEQDRPEAHLYARIAQVPITLVDDLAEVVRLGTTKLVCVVYDGVEASRCEAAMREELGETARVTRSLPQFVEIGDLRAGKGLALARLCRRLGIHLGEVLAIGDAPNDVDMLETAGLAVAVETAPESVLEHADAVCAPPEQAGVADVLEALGLSA